MKKDIRFRIWDNYEAMARIPCNEISHVFARPFSGGVGSVIWSRITRHEVQQFYQYQEMWFAS